LTDWGLHYIQAVRGKCKTEVG